MSDCRFHFDLRDTRFVLFEHLRIGERILPLPAFDGLAVDDVEALLTEGLKFAQKVLAPANAPGDRQGCRFDNGKVYLPDAYRAVFRHQADSGWVGMTCPREYGGQGLPQVVGLALGEMFMGANSALSMLPGLTQTAAELIAAHGDSTARQRYVRPLVEDRWQGTMCLTEPQAGSAVGSVQTSVVRREEGYFVRGQKIFISGGDHDLAENVVHLVLARIEGAPAGTKGLSLFLVPKRRVESDGSLGADNDVACVGIEHKLGIHGSPTCAMSFGGRGQCQGFLIGAEHQGIDLMFEMMNAARVGVGLQGVALGAAAYLTAVAYAKERLQGAEAKNFRDPSAPAAPIIKHPDVRRMLATMKALVEGCRALVLYTAAAIDLCQSSADEATRERMRRRADLLTPICKAYGSDSGVEVTNLALQTFGGHGYLKDYPIEQYVRDARIAPIYEGTNGIQALDLLVRKVGRKQGLLFMECMEDLGQFLERHATDETLAPLVAQLAARKARLESITMGFAMQQMAGQIELPLLAATPYLTMFGHLLAGWLLTEQAAIAHESLVTICSERGVSTPESRAALVAEHSEARFYDDKIKTARYFVNRVLPAFDGLAAGIESQDTSALELSF